MSKLVWDAVGERLYETGTSKGVLYPQVAGAYPKGVAWNGLIGVTESPSGAEATPLYADDIKYLNLMSVEDFGGTIEGYMYPDEFKPCIGEKELTPGVSIGQQARQAFGFCYRTVLGNDTEENNHGYKLHIVYGAKASTSERAYTSINDTPEPITMSWEFTTTPVEVTDSKPTAYLVVDSTKVDADKLAELEDILHGTNDAEPMLPLPDAILAIFADTVA